MFCTNCGSEVKEGAAFCSNCGSPVKNGAAAAQTAQPAQKQEQTQQTVEPTQKKESCLKAAFVDYKSSRGVFGKTLLLGLIQFIPILNFVAAGYSMRWGRDVAYGSRQTMPPVKVDGKNFTLGFFFFVLSVIVGLVISIVGGILGFIPVLGTLASIALSICLYMFLYLQGIRVAVFDHFGSGFEFKALWKKYATKENFGSLLTSLLVPLVIAMAVSIVLMLIALLIVFLVAGPEVFYLLSGMSSGYYSADVAMDYMFYLFGGPLIVVCLILALVFGYIICVFTAVAQLISLRAYGHWVQRNASDWLPVSYTASVSSEPAEQSEQPAEAEEPKEEQVEEQVAEEAVVEKAEEPAEQPVETTETKGE